MCNLFFGIYGLISGLAILRLIFLVHERKKAEDFLSSQHVDFKYRLDLFLDSLEITTKSSENIAKIVDLHERNFKKVEEAINRSRGYVDTLRQDLEKINQESFSFKQSSVLIKNKLNEQASVFNQALKNMRGNNVDHVAGVFASLQKYGIN